MPASLSRLMRKILPQSLQRKIRARSLYRLLPDDVKPLVEALKPGDICVDCGANVGKVSELFASYGATVHSFEPNPHAYAALVETAGHMPGIRPIPKAVGLGDVSELDLYFHEHHDDDPLAYSQGSSLMQDKPNVAGQTVKVQVEDFAAFLKKLGQVKILKIDIEGYETELLPHLVKENALEQVEHIFVETHDQKWPGLKDATDKMRQIVANSPLANNIRYDWP